MSQKPPKPQPPKQKKPKLSENFAQLVTFFVQYYNLHQEVLSVDAAFEQYGVPKSLTTKALASKEFREALTEQGVIFGRSDPDGDWTSKSLTPQQLVVANTMLDLVDTRSQKKKLQDLQVSTATYNAWLRDPVFKAYLHERAEALLGDSKHEAHTALVDKVRAGDIKAIAYYNEITGRYTAPRSTSGSNNQVDMQNLIVKIIEIIDLHVTDSDAKLAIAEDFKKLIAARSAAYALTTDDPLPAPNPVGVPVVETSNQETLKELGL